MPEAIAVTDPAMQQSLDERLSLAAREHSVFLLAGVVTKSGSLMQNRAWVFGPSGERLVDYAKHHPVGWMHSRMAVLRGGEGGLSVIRSAEDGVVTVSDPYGRVLAQARSRTASGTAVLAKAEIGPRIATVYSQIGNLFGYVCIAAMVIAISLALGTLRVTGVERLRPKPAPFKPPL